MTRTVAPNFLIIGSMKSGTTTLFHDLDANPEVYLPPSKEVGALRYDTVLTQGGMQRYGAYFRGAGSALAIGEASTAYTKRPSIEGIPRRASQVLGDGLRLIYVVRDPWKRLISQYRHEFKRGDHPDRLERALQQQSGLVDLSRYAYQLEPWIEHFDRDRVLIVSFENYIARRSQTLAEVCEFLGVGATQSDPADGVYNAGDGARPPGRFVKRFIEGHLYKAYVKPAIPDWARHVVAKTLLRRREVLEPSLAVSDQTRQRIARVLDDDSSALCEMLGTDEAPWGARACTYRLA